MRSILKTIGRARQANHTAYHGNSSEWEPDRTSDSAYDGKDANRNLGSTAVSPSARRRRRGQQLGQRSLQTVVYTSRTSRR